MGRRLFVSIDFPPEIQAAVTRVQAPFDGIPGVRATDPEQTHVTLKFLGDTDASRIERVEEALVTAVSRADVGPFTACVGGLGVFPEYEYISVIWVGVRDGATAMTRLHEAIEVETTSLGFDLERHEFTPHATIARMDHGEGKGAVQRLLRERDPDLGTFDVEAVSLHESTLAPDGPVYDTVTRFPL